MNTLFSKKNNFLLLITLLSIFLLSLVLSKVFFTPIGYDSIGRMFHYYINYDDFGFIKRGLWGTFLHYLGLNNFIENKYVEYLVIYLAVSIAFIMSFWCFFNKNTPSQLSIQDICLAVIVVLSPSMFLHLGYSLGNFDLILLFIFLINIQMIDQGKILIAALISSCAILIHEIYLLTSLPLLLWIVLEKYNLKTSIKFSILPMISTVSLLLWGKIEISKEAYLLQLEKISPYLLKRDGFFEMTSSVLDNINVGIASLSDPANWTWVPIVAIYVALIFTFLLNYVDQNKIKYFTLGIIACFVPLILSIVGNDVFRWVSFVVFNLFIFMIINRKEPTEAPSRAYMTLVICILLFVFLGPMGSVFNNRPFPIIQTVLHIN